MTELEVELLQGRNVGLVDLFDPRHARKVLMAFGTAFGAFPEQEENLSKEHNAFLDQAVTGLCLDGKVISVRLVLFAEMIKGKPWTPATLRAVGGIRGVGATFLEETFTASTAPPQHRLHQQAAQAVLNALLPEAGADIKGHMRSRQELLEVSGYAGRLREFDELLRILDGELRLITPTDPEGMAGSGQQRAAGGGWRVADEEDKDTQGKAPVSSPATRHPPPATRYYQLTHDYLVHSLRDWLTRKQKETPGGRAELLLADRATVWNARRESRQLPSLWQWLQIRLLTQKKNWLPVQRLMMQDAGRYHAVRGLVLALVLVALWAVGLVVRSEIVEQNNAHHAAALVQTLLRSETPQVPAIVQDMAPYRRWLDPLLHDAFAKAEAHGDARQQLHASLALLPVDATQVEYLERRLLDAEPREVAVIRDALAGQHAELVERLWAVVEKPPKGKERRRLRAAAALAKYDPDSPRWDQRREAVANDLVALPSVYLATWMEYFRPVRDKLLAPLGVIYRDGKRRETERSLATDLVADYTSDRPAELADLLMDADEKQFAVLYPKFLLQQQRGLPVLLSEVERILPLDATEEEKEKLAKRQANAAVALLRMDQPEKVWPLLKHRPDARVRSYLLHRFGPLGVDAEVIVRRLQDERDITMRRALILSLGPEEFGEQAWTSEEKKLLVQQLQETYRTAGDPGLRAASEWLLRQWHEEAWLEQTDQAWAEDAPRRTKRLESIRQALAQEKPSPQWYVTGKGQTMVVIPGPVEFKMGSPATEAGRNPVEQQHRRRISRTFAIAAKPVTVKQYLAFQASYQYIKQNAPSDDCPVHGTTWKMAAEYCNWLSDQEGIPKEDWCYETDAKGAVTKLKAGYLSLTGYRLSTEAEWEFACRAGATTARYYGESEELLGKYGWYLANAQDRSWPVGSKKPNDLGFFDMHGNVACWCQDNFQEYPAASDDKVFEDKEGELEIAPTIARVLRGGSFINLARYVRSADRVRNFPLTRSINFGFRLARTLQ